MKSQKKLVCFNHTQVKMSQPDGDNFMTLDCGKKRQHGNSHHISIPYQLGHIFFFRY